ncbi:MAG: glycosyltransferase family 2 protein [Bacteroidetes bacterium]|nr:glycosyltransferase family 2 protein [Bacteroidota bacterium]
MISVLILTLNEEKNLPVCLPSLSWCDDVVVLDSFSTDQTQQIATRAGVRFFQRRFDNYAAQRTYGLNEIAYQHPWLLMVDADEIWPEELIKEIEIEITKQENKICLYRFRRKDFFMGQWLKRSTGYPTWTGRLLKLGHVKVERNINEEYNTCGQVGFLKGHYHHFSFNNGITAWLNKHNRYSTMEAELLIQGDSEKLSFKNIFHNDPTVKRKAIKSIVYRMPGRPFLMFIALYIFRGGFLDGKAGFIFCTLRAIYEYMIDLKVEEQKRRKKHLPV